MTKCKCVYETAKNTPAVRSGHVLGGAVKEECDHCKQQRSSLVTDQKQAPERTVADVLQTLVSGEFYEDYDQSSSDLGIIRNLAKQRDELAAENERLDRMVRSWMKACDIRRESGENLSRENRDLKSRAEKAEAERDEADKTSDEHLNARHIAEAHNTKISKRLTEARAQLHQAKADAWSHGRIAGSFGATDEDNPYRKEKAK